MRRVSVLLFALTILICLCVVANAETSITSIVSQATVSTDGSCQVNTTATVHLDQPMEELAFPVPEDATAVTLNGTRVLTKTADGLRAIDLSRILGGMAGDFTFSINYRLPDLVSPNDDGILQLNMPLLSGFSYPVKAFELTVAMPGPIDTKPRFISGYHQTNIEKDLAFNVDSSTIICRSQKAMKDHETLAMSLTVSDEMFPQSVILAPDLKVSNVICIVFAVLTGLYWLFFLRCLVPFGQKRTTPPDGFSAGEMGSVLHLRGADLTLMVLTWAQLGYLLIHHDRNGRVQLYKQMEMGNERNSFERRCFHHLFARKAVVDTASLHYVTQYQKVASMKPNLQGFVKKGSGNVRIFRILGSLIGLGCGISLGIMLGAEAAMQWFVVAACAVFGVVSCYHIQSWAYSLLQQDKSRIWISLALCVLWLILGLVAKLFNIALWAVVAGLTVGLLAAFAGRRTPEGRQAMAQVFGLRRYLVGVSAGDISRICATHPEYFHDLAPYAIALNADKRFAKCFGDARTSCPYIADDKELSLTASQWSEYMRLVVDTMNARIQQMPMERFVRIIRSFRK